MLRSSKTDPLLDAIQEQLDYVSACEYAAGFLRSDAAHRLFATAVADLESMMVEYDGTRHNLPH
jgi:hypothetical protein